MKLSKQITKRVSLTMAIAVCAVQITYPVFAKDYEQHWARPAIERWMNKEIVKGYEDGSFRPHQAVTRAELASMITRILDLQDAKFPKNYVDVNKEKWYAKDIGNVAAMGLMNDYGLNFKPDEPATREEAAYALSQVYKINGATSIEFVDEETISPWAVDAVAALTNQGYIKGNPDGSFAPQKPLTRAEWVTMLDQITGEIITKKGVYTGVYKNNVIVNGEDIILQDMSIKGNLYLTPGLSTGKITLKNVQVTGKLYIEGGQEIEVENSIIPVTEINVKGVNTPSLIIKGISNLGVTNLYSQANLNDLSMHKNAFKQINIKTNQPVTLVQGEFANVQINPGLASAKVEIQKNAIIHKLDINSAAMFSGVGKIIEANINCKGVKIIGITPQIQNVLEGIELPKRPGGGGGGGGGGIILPEIPEPPKPPKPEPPNPEPPNPEPPNPEPPKGTSKLSGYLKIEEITIPNTEVSLRQAGQIIKKVKTDSKGYYQLEDLQPGIYDLEVQYHGEEQDYYKKIRGLIIREDYQQDIALEMIQSIYIKINGPIDTQGITIKINNQEAQLSHTANEVIWLRPNIGIGQRLEIKIEDTQGRYYDEQITTIMQAGRNSFKVDLKEIPVQSETPVPVIATIQEGTDTISGKIALEGSYDLYIKDEIMETPIEITGLTESEFNLELGRPWIAGEVIQVYAKGAAYTDRSTTACITVKAGQWSERTTTPSHIQITTGSSIEIDQWTMDIQGLGTTGSWIIVEEKESNKKWATQVDEQGKWHLKIQVPQEIYRVEIKAIEYDKATSETLKYDTL